MSVAARLSSVWQHQWDHLMDEVMPEERVHSCLQSGSINLLLTEAVYQKPSPFLLYHMCVQHLLLACIGRAVCAQPTYLQMELASASVLEGVLEGRLGVVLLLTSRECLSCMPAGRCKGLGADVHIRGGVRLHGDADVSRVCLLVLCRWFASYHALVSLAAGPQLHLVQQSED